LTAHRIDVGQPHSSLGDDCVSILDHHRTVVRHDLGCHINADGLTVSEQQSACNMILAPSSSFIFLTVPQVVYLYAHPVDTPIQTFLSSIVGLFMKSVGMIWNMVSHDICAQYRLLNRF
jgi:hypothetical protein